MSDNNQGQTDKPSPDALLVEYQAAQDSAQHHDSLIWSVNSVVWAGSLVLVGFTLEHATNPDLKFVLLAVSVLGIVMIIKVWVYTWQFRALKRQKYDRCKEIETDVGLEQHSRVKWPSGQVAYSGVSIASSWCCSSSSGSWSPSLLGAAEQKQKRGHH